MPESGIIWRTMTCEWASLFHREGVQAPTN